MHVGLAVTHVAAPSHALPEPAHEFPSRYVAPAPIDVALVAALVDDYRLPVQFAPSTGALQIMSLDALVGHPGLGVVIEDVVVVNGPKMVVRILFLDDPKEPIPIGHALRFHKIELVGQGPPHVALGREPGDDVA